MKIKNYLKFFFCALIIFNIPNKTFFFQFIKFTWKIKIVARFMGSPSQFSLQICLKFKFFRGIAEVPENISDTSSVDPTLNTVNQTSMEPVIEKIEIAPVAEEPPPMDISAPSGEQEYYISSYPYQSVEQGDLSFNAGELIIVVKKEGDWWTGKIGEKIGIFPSNYVQKMDMVSVFFLLLFYVITACSLITKF